MSPDKKISALEFRCDLDFKEQVDALANSLDMDRSEFLRAAVEKEVSRHRQMYESLHKAFGSESESVSDSVGRKTLREN